MKKITQELTKKSAQDIGKEIETIRSEIAKSRIESTINKPKDTNAAFRKRKRLAVLLTIKTQKEEQK